MRRFVLDTSVFTNPHVAAQFGEDSAQGLTTFLELARRCPAEFYMPLSVYEEFRGMRDLAELAADFETVVWIRSPRRFSLTIPSDVLYEFIDEVRGRIDRGLRIAEEHTKRAGAASGMPPALITQLRERFREAMRKGLVDSREDVDAVLLALELDAELVSADEGMRKLGNRMGIKLLTADYLRRVMENLARE
ncbi:RNA ligase partner protein [Sediminicurvatus halobius]|uniref:RNA-free ribonuclease P n=1 Tax=Sediminicurvatus halobius TaxID=2182432 RepID=A0A2U2N5E5_9GAMM|nr:RNA ligase partner protein [Spiribacter halobius]PWG64350.1 RNA ligase partner protein [Spiribacter halobius]UEX79303.1 RNA ligase partner protein [Spiribacter halobius]